MGDGFKKSASGKGQKNWLSREGDKGIPPGMPSGKGDSTTDGKIAFLSRQGDKGTSHWKSKGSSSAAPLD
jgi:hypothetical protein